MIRDVYCTSQIPGPDFFSMPDPAVKKSIDPALGSGSAILQAASGISKRQNIIL
jgi:hypothetical protein